MKRLSVFLLMLIVSQSAIADWGERWGEMIWGIKTAAFVAVPFGTWALLLLGFVIGVCALLSRKKKTARILVGIFAVALLPALSVVISPT